MADYYKGSPYQDVRDYSPKKPATPKKKKKKNGGQKFEQLDLDLATVESFRKRHNQSVNL